MTDLDELRRHERQGKKLRFLLFWGHGAAKDGGLGPGCLSQWWPARFTVDGVPYRTAEQFMMVAKAHLFGDEATAARILATGDPAAAKALGRTVAGFDEQVWSQRRFDIVVTASLAKFGQDPDLRAYLLGTGDLVLVEASPVDRVWGIGLAADDERAKRPSRWRGLNLLGFALMEARESLKPQPQHSPQPRPT